MKMTPVRWMCYSMVVAFALFVAICSAFAHLGNTQMVGIAIGEGAAKMWLLLSVVILGIGMPIVSSRERAVAFMGNLLGTIIVIMAMTMPHAIPLYGIAAIMLALTAVYVGYVPKKKAVVMAQLVRS